MKCAYNYPRQWSMSCFSRHLPICLSFAACILHHFGNVPFNPLHIGFFLIFAAESASVINIKEKWVNRFSWNFQDSSHMRQGTINLLQMLHLTPWNLVIVVYGDNLALLSAAMLTYSTCQNVVGCYIIIHANAVLPNGARPTAIRHNNKHAGFPAFHDFQPHFYPSDNAIWHGGKREILKHFCYFCLQ